MARMPGANWVGLPASYSVGRPAGSPRLIVIHYTAGSEGPTAAEDGAAYDKRRTDGTSTHFFTDSNSIVQEVDTGDRAHAALYNGNMYGVQIEQCGTAQSRAQWLDAASRPMITNTARVCAWLMAYYNIPLTRLVDSQVRGGRGLCGHGDITRGFWEDGGTHTDPGAEYPWDVLFSDIKEIQEGTVALTQDDIDKVVQAVWAFKPFAGNAQAGWLNAGAAVGQSYLYLTNDSDIRKMIDAQANPAEVKTVVADVINSAISNIPSGGGGITQEQLDKLTNDVSAKVVEALKAGIHISGTWTSDQPAPA